MAKSNGGSVLVMTERGPFVRQIKTIERGRVIDDEGVTYTRPMLWPVLGVSNKPFFVAALDVNVFANMEEMAGDLAGVIMSRILETKSSILHMAQWVVLGVLAVMVLVLSFQIGGLRRTWTQDIAVLQGYVQSLIVVEQQPEQIR